MCRKIVSFLCSCLVLTSLAGCESLRDLQIANLGDLPVEKSLAPATKAQRQSMSFEVAFVTLPPEEGALLDNLWSRLDELVVPADSRNDFQANGLRVGRINSSIADFVASLGCTKERKNREKSDHQAEAQQVRLQLRQKDQAEFYVERLQLQPGQPGGLLASETRPKRVVLCRDEAGDLTGSTYFNAEGKFILHATPLEDGRVQVRLEPELHHGQEQHQYSKSRNGVVQLNYSKEIEQFKNLSLQVPLAPGATLVLAKSGKMAENNLGGTFFSVPGKPNHRRVLLIRLVQTQHDGNFE